MAKIKTSLIIVVGMKTSEIRVEPGSETLNVIGMSSSLTDIIVVRTSTTEVIVEAGSVIVVKEPEIEVVIVTGGTIDVDTE